MRAATLLLKMGVLLGTIAFLGCEQVDTGDTPLTDRTTTTTTTDEAPPAADNTEVNERDASGASKTPIDQDETQRDVNITAEIRDRILKTEGMSINAQNAKVITARGEVTLRGPVESAEERDTIERIAREVAGEGKVENFLEVAGQPATQAAPLDEPDTRATPRGSERPVPSEPATPTTPETPGASDRPEVPETPANETPAAPETPATPE